MATDSATVTSPASLQKVRQLVAYLRDFVSLRSKATKKIESYQRQGAVVWFHEMPHEKDCQSLIWSDAEDGDDDVWLRVRQQKMPKRPAVPESLVPWVDERDLQRTEEDFVPTLESVAFIPRRVDSGQFAEPEEQRLDEHPEILQGWNNYLPSWIAWAKEYRRKQRVQRVYRELYAIHQQLEQNGEMVELALGLGLLQWKRSSGDIRRHVLTYRTELKFDLDLGEISLLYPESGARPIVEDDMLEPDDRPAPSLSQEALKHRHALIDDPWNQAKLENFFGAWAKALHDAGQASMDLVPADTSSEEPIIDFAPALLLRPRGTAPILQVYNALHEQLSAENPVVPFGLLRLVEDVNDDDQANLVRLNGDSAVSKTQVEDIIYFPKPSNPEQRLIVEKLRRRHGVLVQGPPGTGKSYTIGNLIAHLLAEGKRILITSEGPRALKVLSEHIPEELRPLCVRNLGGDADSFKELEQCVSGIEQRHAVFDSNVYARNIERLGVELDSERRRLAEIDLKLRTLRESETLPVEVGQGAYVGTPARISQQLTAQHPQHGWCKTGPETPVAPPLLDHEFDYFVQLGAYFGEDKLAATNLKLPDESRLISGDEFRVLVDSLGQLENEAKGVSDWLQSDFCQPFLRLTPEQHTDVGARLSRWSKSFEEWRAKSAPWGILVLRDLIEGKLVRWEVLRDNSKTLLGEVEPSLGKVDLVHLECPESRSLQQLEHDATAMADHLEQGGRWGLFGLPLGKTSDYFYLKKECRVNGAPARAAESLRLLAEVSGVKIRMSKLHDLWNAVHAESSATLSVQYSELTLRQQNLEMAFNLAEQLKALNTLFVQLGLPELAPEDERINHLQFALEVADIARSLGEAQARYRKAVAPLDEVKGATVHPSVKEMEKAARERSPEKWEKLRQNFQALHKEQQASLLFAEMGRRFQTADKNVLANVRSSWADPQWNESRAPLAKAWKWGHASHWLDSHTSNLHLRQLISLRSKCSKKIEVTTAELAAEKAWLHFLTRVHQHPEQSNALRAWREAVKALGKGTGKSRRSEDLRRSARENATRASDSIPAWIMPRYKVAEMMSVRPESFDVIIVDEASQSGIESLFLFYLAKKIIIVGDDQQISPSLGFVDAEQISALQRHHLRGIPHDVALRPESSLYANAKIRFDGVIVLREHFRCASEIIQFSNSLCYEPNGTPLDPLRLLQHPRLVPLAATFVAEGYREGGANAAINRPEAEALVDCVAKCHEDPAYKDKTFGVISLQGEAQAKLIEKLMMEHPLIGTKVMATRKIACGDAYDFQGDERSVMFLSLVVAPNQDTIGVLSKQSDYQRFNVAASRARDQMWLFHSVQVSDLSQQCVRYKLLNYILHPHLNTLQEKDQRFDSEFEREVYQKIVARGYRVRTQVAIGDAKRYRYRIDLVVDGLRNRLAVECDGDEWHGPERYEEDMARQRNLERAGWTFWRVRGSEYYANPDRSLDDLWKTLDSLGIGSNETGVDAQTVNITVSTSSAAPMDDLLNASLTVQAGSIDQSGAVGGTKEESRARNVAVQADLLADPRLASQKEIILGFETIVKSEGPVVCSRVYSLYAKQAGLGRLTKSVTSILNKAMAKAVRSNVLVQLADGRKGQAEKTVRLPEQSDVIVRQHTARRWDEIPPSELKAVAEAYLQQQPNLDRSLLARNVYEFYGGVRLRKDTEAEILQIISEPADLVGG